MVNNPVNGIRKDGFFFTVLGLFLVLLLVALVGLISLSNRGPSMVAEDVRIATMNSFLNDFERDAKRAVYITSFRAINSVINHITASGAYENNFSSAFEEAFFNGSVDGVKEDIMNNATFYDWLGRVKKIADTYAINLSVKPVKLKIIQNSPWLLGVILNISISAKDRTDVASWNYNTSVATNVSIIGFEDPVYAISSLGRIFNKIKKWQGSYFVSGNDTTNLKEFINGSYYTEDPNAPSFIMRLEGRFSSSPNGIESIFNLPAFSDQGLEVKDASAVDYVYLGNSTPELYIINNTYEDWLRIDKSHLDLYQVENISRKV